MSIASVHLGTLKQSIRGTHALGCCEFHFHTSELCICIQRSESHELRGVYVRKVPRCTGRDVGPHLGIKDVRINEQGLKVLTLNVAVRVVETPAWPWLVDTNLPVLPGVSSRCQLVPPFVRHL